VTVKAAETTTGYMMRILFFHVLDIPEASFKYNRPEVRDLGKTDLLLDLTIREA
jgi:hypothetical protein